MTLSIKEETCSERRLHSNRFYSCAVQCDATISCKREEVLRVIIIIIIIIIIIEKIYI